MQGLSSKLSAIVEHLPFLISEVWLAVLVLLVVVVDLVLGKGKAPRAPIWWIALLGIAVNFYWINRTAFPPIDPFLLGMMKWWPDAAFLKNLFNLSLLATLLLAKLSAGHSEDKRLLSGEFLTVLLSMLLGLQLMVGAANWLILYLSIEMVSIGSYILTFFRYNRQSAEASLKYLIFGAVSSAVMLYGISLLYGLTGSLQLAMQPEAGAPLPLDAAPIPAFVAMAMVFGGLFFKIAAIPFHIWAPDVYEAAPTPLVAFLSVAPKGAGIAVLLHLVDEWQNMGDVGYWLIYLLIAASAISMIVGNFSALWQKDAKRLLAYSSIAHAGFMLMAVLSFSATGRESIYFYLSTYFLLNYAAFVLVSGMEHDKRATMDDMQGLGLQIPWLGVAMLVVMVGLTGLPLTAGFNAKLFVFSSLWETYQTTQDQAFFWLFTFGLLNTVVALYYYLKIPFLMFFREREGFLPLIAFQPSLKVLAIVFLFPILLFFFKPDWLVWLIQSMA